MSARTRIYLAGPLGFTEAGRYVYYAVLVPFLAGLGYEVLDPWAQNDPDAIAAVQRMPGGARRLAAWRRLNRQIGTANRAAIDRAHGMVAILDGPDVDSGTAAEIGYAFARGKRIVGYRGDFRPGADNEGGVVNLQVEFFIRESGGTIVTRYEDLEEGLAALRAQKRRTGRAGRGELARPPRPIRSRRYPGSPRRGGIS